jgi:hypothetical protein
MFPSDATLSGSFIVIPSQRSQQPSEETDVIQLQEATPPTQPTMARDDGGYPWESTSVARLRARIEELISLPADWDAHGGVAVQPSAVVQALTLLEEVLPKYVFLPSLIPTHDGELALEWHTPSLSLEIQVGPSGVGSAYFRNRTTGVEWERDLREVRPGLGQILQEFAARG